MNDNVVSGLAACSATATARLRDRSCDGTRREPLICCAPYSNPCSSHAAVARHDWVLLLIDPERPPHTAVPDRVSSAGCSRRLWRWPAS